MNDTRLSGLKISKFFIMFVQMSNVTDVLVCASSFLDPKVLNGLSQGVQLASAVGIVAY